MPRSNLQHKSILFPNLTRNKERYYRRCLKNESVYGKLRASIKAESESLKRLVEKTMLDNLEQADNMEKTLMEKLQSQDKI